MKKKIKTSFVCPTGPNARAYEIVIHIMIFMLLFIEKYLKYDTIHDFSVWLRTGSNLADINRFQTFVLKF